LNLLAVHSQTRIYALKSDYFFWLRSVARIILRSIEKSAIECALSRGDSRVSDVIEEAWKAGARFDNWTDHFDYDLWVEAFNRSGLDIGFYTTRDIGLAEVLPWDIIDIGISKEFFISEYRKAEGISLDNKGYDNKI